MSADDPTDPDDAIEPADVRAELDRQRTATDRPDGPKGLVDLLSVVHDTDIRARVYVHLRRHPRSTPEEIAEGTGLYPGAVHRILDDLRDEGVVEVGGETAETYTAVAPDGVVSGFLGRLRDGFGGNHGSRSVESGTDRAEPVTIPVEDADE